MTADPTRFVEARRELRGLTAAVEKRTLLWLAARMPVWLTPDHLTALGLLAMCLGGVFYALSGRDPRLLHLVNLCLALNWFGDSLDGTLARHRQRLRPRYGFYVDHIVDALGALFLVVGLGCSGYMSPAVAACLLIVYYLFSINLYLATYALGVFKMSYGIFGGTELRILLALGNLWLLAAPRVNVVGAALRLYDVLGVFAIGVLAAVLLASVVENTRELFDRERL
jgi:phosphatidylglycerophosphate synthase